MRIARMVFCDPPLASIAMAVSLLLIGCAEEPTRPEAVFINASSVHPSFSSSSHGALMGMVIDGDSYSGTPHVPLGTVAGQRLLHVEASGIVELWTSDIPMWGGNANTYVRDVDPAGQYSASYGYQGSIEVYFDGIRRVLFGDYLNQIPLTETFSRHVISGGVVTARRNGGPRPFLGVCNTGPDYVCYVYKGEQTVTVTPVEAELILTPSYAALGPSESVTVVASADPSAVDGLNVPFGVQAWHWQPDDGSPSTQVCGTNSSCAMAPSTSGTLSCDALVNGEPLSSTARLVRRCDTGNSVLDSLEVQEGLNYVFAYSLANEVEYGAWIIQRPDGTHYLDPFPESWPAAECGINPPDGTMPPSNAVGWVHTHPWSIGDQVPECGVVEIAPGVSIPINYSGRASGEDHEAAGVWGPGWLIDKNNSVHFNDMQELERYPRCGY